MGAQPAIAEEADETSSEVTIDELARRTDLPVRTIREYQTMGLLPPPLRRGRVGYYGASHRARLALIRRLQARGYSLAGIRDLLESWRDGEDLGEVLGLTSDELVHIEEPGVALTADQLAAALPELVPSHLDDLLATGIVEGCGPDRYCVPSPSLFQLTRDALTVGYSIDAVLDLLRAIGDAANQVADASVEALAQQPAHGTTDELVSFATRARGLLAHGTGRLTIHTLGKRIGITDEADVRAGIRQLIGGTTP